MLGSSLLPFLKDYGYNALGIGNSSKSDINIDVTDLTTLCCLLDHFKPDLIVNLGALTNVDLCENNPDFAYTLNVKPAENLAYWIHISKVNCHLIHLSTISMMVLDRILRIVS